MNDVQPDNQVVDRWAAPIDATWDTYDWSQHERTIEVDGRSVNYVDLGDHNKPVLLFVHGIMGTWRNWLFNLLPFADRYRVIALDLPGFGRSEMPAEKLTMDNYAKAVKGFCDKLGIQQVTLVGNSMGGLIGALVAKSTPELLTKLVLVDAAGFSTANRHLRRITRYRRFLNAFFAFGYLIRKVIAANKYLAAAFTKIVLWRPMNVSSELILVLLSGIGKPGFVDAARSIAFTRIDRAPGEITTETMIIWGRNDSLIPKRDAFRYAKMLPDARLELIDDTGHIPMFETPEKFNALIEDFAAGGIAATTSAAA
ncbi:MAG: alpha/beta fold hydrolase [Solirubrobacterales bacterium]